MLRRAKLAQNPTQLPGDRFGTNRRVWAMMLYAAQAPTSAEMATTLGLHRGNIDRALQKLRAAGRVTSDDGYHYPLDPHTGGVLHIRRHRPKPLYLHRPRPPGPTPEQLRVLEAVTHAGATTTAEIAQRLSRHRGNIDRALTALRDAGLVRRVPGRRGYHQAVLENSRRA